MILIYPMLYAKLKSENRQMTRQLTWREGNMSEHIIVSYSLKYNKKKLLTGYSGNSWCLGK